MNSASRSFSMQITAPAFSTHKAWRESLRRALALALSIVIASAAMAASLPVSSPLSTLPGTMVAPARVTVDSHSQLYITDPLAGNVLVVNPLSQLVVTQTNLGQPLGIAVDAQDRIYVGDAKIGTTTIFDSQWNAIGQLGHGAGEFKLPGYITTTANNGSTTVFVSDGLAHCVKAYRDGVLATQLGSYGSGPGQFNFPAGIWASPEGILFVVDQNNDRIQVLDQNGTFLRWFTLQPEPMQISKSGRGQGITGDAQGRLFVADAFQGRVKVFTATGSFLGHMGEFGESLGQLRTPSDIALDGSGRLWLANANNARVDGFCFVQPTIQPTAQTVADGTTVTFSADAGCGGMLRFQWLKDAVPLLDGGVVTGVTNTTLTLTGVTAGDAGSYTVWVGNATGTVTGSPVTLTVITRPFIKTPPAEQTSPLGSNVTFTVVAGGDAPLFYQWSLNGMVLPGQTESSLTLSNVTRAANGVYSVQVTNSVGNASASARFAVAAIPDLAFTYAGADGLALSWNDPFYVLQSATDLGGPWQTISVTSPFTVAATSISQTAAQYFRLNKPGN